MTAPTTRRINSGRGHSYVLDGVPADGVTWAINEGIPKPGLIGWAANTTRDYAIDHWDELHSMTISERVKLLSKARFEKRDGAGERGTAVHKLAQRLAAGDEVDVPEALTGHVDAYLKFVHEWKPIEILIEAVVLNRRFRYMGTLDVIADLADGMRWMLDFKTTASGVWSENALQQAAYRNCETYLDPDGLECDMLSVNRCGVVWLRADGYDLVPVDAGERTFKVFLFAQQIARWRNYESHEVVGDAILPPMTEVEQEEEVV